MKKLLMICALLFGSTTWAATTESTIWLGSDHLYRGASLSDGEVTLGLDFQVTDVLVPGLYVQVSPSVWGLTGGTQGTDSRIDAGFGYQTPLGFYDINYDVSLHRVLTSDVAVAGPQYNEFRNRFSRNFTEDFTVYSDLNYAFGGDASDSVFWALGASYDVLDNVWVAGEVATRYGDVFGDWYITHSGDWIVATREVERKTTYNHAALKAGWDITSQLGLYAMFSNGESDLGLDNEWAIGSTYRF